MEAKSSTPQNPSDQNHSQPTNSQNPYPKMDANQNPDSETPLAKTQKTPINPPTRMKRGKLTMKREKIPKKKKKRKKESVGFACS